MPFTARNPRWEETVRRVFERATFVRDLGIEIASCAPGVCETTAAVVPRHAQQDGFVHAGVLATMADHTAGMAAGSLVGEGETILTFEMHVTFLRPARGDSLRCRGTVLKPGRTVTFAEAEVYCGATLVAKASVTLAVVPLGSAGTSSQGSGMSPEGTG